MKQLISLISTEGKTPEQAVKESWQAYLKFKKVESQVLQKMSQQKPQKKPQLQPQPKEKRDPSSLPQRLLIPFSLSAEEALAAVKKFFSDYQGIKLISK